MGGPADFVSDAIHDLGGAPRDIINAVAQVPGEISGAHSMRDQQRRMQEQASAQAQEFTNKIEGQRREAARNRVNPEEQVKKRRKKLLSMRNGIASTFVSQRTASDTAPIAGSLNPVQPVVKKLLGV